MKIKKKPKKQLGIARGEMNEVFVEPVGIEEVKTDEEVKNDTGGDNDNRIRKVCALTTKRLEGYILILQISTKNDKTGGWEK